MLQHNLKSVVLPKRKVEIDSGYAYVILFSGFMLRIFESYQNVTFGIYLIEFMEYFDTDDTFSIALIGGLYPLFQALAGLCQYQYYIFTSYLLNYEFSVIIICLALFRFSTKIGFLGIFKQYENFIIILFEYSKIFHVNDTIRSK